MTSRGEPAAEKSFEIVKRKKILQKYRRGRFAVGVPTKGAKRLPSRRGHQTS